MLRNWKVSTKLGAGFGLMLLLFVGAVCLAIGQMGRIAGHANYYAVNIVPSLQLMREMSVELGDLRRLEFGHILANSDAAMNTAEQRLADVEKQLSDRFAKYEKDLVSDGEDLRLLKEANQALQAYRKLWEPIRVVSRKTPADPSQSAVAMTLIMGESAGAYEAAQTAVGLWWAYNVKLGQQEDLAAAGDARTANAWLLGVAGISLLAALGAAMAITRDLQRQLGGEPAQAVAVSNRIAQGDLSQEVPTRPGDAASVAAALRVMQERLKAIVSQVRTSSDSIATGSAQIAGGNADLSQRTEEQSSALQQTSATMEELGTTVRHNAANAQQANQLAASASTVARRGGEVVAEVVQTMKGINDSSRKISDIIGVIDGIAFQTNILALNAAVEAARAGEQGRGFAVVASEVRSLAGRSAEAAKEIKALITGSVAQVEQGTALVDRAGATMSEIVAAIQRVNDIVGEISTASAEQSEGVTQVAGAVAQMDQVTQQNAALVEQSAAAAESLRQQAQQLVQAVGVFDLGAGADLPMPPRGPGFVERRGPDRARNVVRPAFASARPKGSSSLPAASPAPRAEPLRNGTDDWASF